MDEKPTPDRQRTKSGVEKESMSIIVGPTQNRNAKPRKDPRAEYLSGFMSPVTYGKKKVEGVRPHLSKYRANDYLSRGWSGAISQKKLLRHFKGLDTYYYWSDLSLPELLLMVDVDCHDSGTPEGAMAFLKFVSETILPGLYYEPSTNGRGGHGYFRLKNDGLSREHVSALVQRITKKLNEIAKNFDVEFVEIKGLPPSVKKPEWRHQPWGGWRLVREVVTYGTFAKIPRLTTNDHLVRLQDTAVLSRDDVASEEWDCEVVRVRVATPKKVMGSVCWFTTDDADALDKYTAWAATQFDDEKTTGRHVVTARDVAIALVVLEKLFGVMKPGDATRSRRIIGLWDKLYKEGLVDRQFDPKRLKAIRNMLSERGLVDWKSNAYRPPVIENGKVVDPGKAMVWRFGAELTSVLSLLRSCGGQEEATLVGTREILTGGGAICYPVKVMSVDTPLPDNWQETIETYDFCQLAA